MIIDTHCHLHFSDFDADRPQVIARAQVAGIRAMICVGADGQTNEDAYALTKRYPFIYNTVGLHPHYCHTVSDGDLEGLIAGAPLKTPVAIGEIGLDYFKSQAPKERQQAVFTRMLDLALSSSLPAVVHSREALEDTTGILETYAKKGLKAVLHCYSYDAAALKKFLALGFTVSFTCNVTYKKSQRLKEAMKITPLDRLMVETDAPYLSPQHLRGKRNEPASLTCLIDFISKELGVAPAEIEKRTTRNAVEFFGLDRRGFKEAL
jgi:TatD DNase family protein